VLLEKLYDRKEEVALKEDNNSGPAQPKKAHYSQPIQV
jgi:hypothetical protein